MEALAIFGPLRPSIRVVAPDAAEDGVTRLQVERVKVKVPHVDVPRGEGARDGREAAETATFSLTLNLSLVDWRAGLGWIPPHNSLCALSRA